MFLRKNISRWTAFTIIILVCIIVLLALGTVDVSAQTPKLISADTGTVSEADQIESVKVISDAVKDIYIDNVITESKIRSDVKDAIDEAIIDVRDQVDVQAYELRNDIDQTENNVFREVRETIIGGSVVDSDNVDALGVVIDNSLNTIETTLEVKYNAEIDISDKRQKITDTLQTYREELVANQALIEERGGDLIEKDTDEDGLSDYDEVYIFNTDPENSNTFGSGLSDSEKIKAGINPVTGEKIEYEDPRTDETAHVSRSYKVKRVELVDNDAGEKRLSLEGTAIPNSLITLYVYSTPVIVTVKTDERGEWSYTFDEELETGEHNVYVATVNNSGKLIARSESIPFTQSSDAAALGTFGIGDTSVTENSFIQENFILVVLAILLAAVLLTLMLKLNKVRKLNLYLHLKQH